MFYTQWVYPLVWLTSLNGHAAIDLYLSYQKGKPGLGAPEWASRANFPSFIFFVVDWTVKNWHFFQWKSTSHDRNTASFWKKKTSSPWLCLRFTICVAWWIWWPGCQCEMSIDLNVCSLACLVKPVVRKFWLCDESKWCERKGLPYLKEIIAHAAKEKNFHGGFRLHYMIIFLEIKVHFERFHEGWGLQTVFVFGKCFSVVCWGVVVSHWCMFAVHLSFDEKSCAKMQHFISVTPNSKQPNTNFHQGVWPKIFQKCTFW